MKSIFSGTFLRFKKREEENKQKKEAGSVPVKIHFAELQFYLAL